MTGHSPDGVALGVFARHWTPGQTKTRLAADIGADAAAKLSKAFLTSTLERLASGQTGATRRVVAFTPDDRGDEFQALVAGGEGGWRCEPQASGTLGERMAAFFERHSPALLVGSDSPNLPLDAVRQASDWLRDDPPGPRLVLGPSVDGGYWLIGARGPLPAIFGQMPWSEPTLFETTVGRLYDEGWREGADYRIVDRWYDVDGIDDLRRLRNDLANHRGAPPDEPLRRLAEQIDAAVSFESHSDQ